MNKILNFKKALIPFQRYAYKVIGILDRKEPKATFSMKFLFLCYGSNIPATVAAEQIIRSYRDMRIKKDFGTKTRRKK